MQGKWTINNSTIGGTEAAISLPAGATTEFEVFNSIIGGGKVGVQYREPLLSLKPETPDQVIVEAAKMMAEMRNATDLEKIAELKKMSIRDWLKEGAPWAAVLAQFATLAAKYY